MDWHEPLTEVCSHNGSASALFLIQQSLNGSLDATSIQTHAVSPVSMNLAGFCDASMRVYAAVVYLRIDDGSHESVKFLAAKKTHFSSG